MVTSEAIAHLRREIAAAKNRGLSEVTLESLSGLIDALEAADKENPGVEQTQAALERFKSELTDWQNRNQRDHESALEMLRATISASHLAIKSALIINGGAAVAFLAFLGGSWSRFPSQGVKAQFAFALESFIWGVLAIGLGSCVAYLCQAAFGGEFGKGGEKFAEPLRWVSVLLVFGSFVMFCVGCRSAIRAFVLAG